MQNSTYKKEHQRLTHIAIGAVVILVLLFFFLQTTKATAGSHEEICGYESVMIRPGDTLDSIASVYSKQYSYLLPAQYKKHILRLNNMSSTYLHAGVKILLPVFPSSSCLKGNVAE